MRYGDSIRMMDLEQQVTRAIVYWEDGDDRRPSAELPPSIFVWMWRRGNWLKALEKVAVST